jgi:hypothetical protein
MESVSASDDPLLARALGSGERAWRRGATSGAREILSLALERAEARGDLHGALGARQLLGHLAFEAGDLALAEAYHRTVLAQSRRIGLGIGRASALHNLGLIAAARGQQQRARLLLATAAARYERLGHADGARAVRANLTLFVDYWGSRQGEGQ